MGVRRPIPEQSMADPDSGKTPPPRPRQVQEAEETLPATGEKAAASASGQAAVPPPPLEGAQERLLEESTTLLADFFNGQVIALAPQEEG